MPRNLVRRTRPVLQQTGREWCGSVDGPFPARVTTNCPEADAQLVASTRQKNQQLSELMQAVESVLGKLTKHRKKKLTALLVPIIAESAGRHWQCGALAEQAHTAFVNGKGVARNAERDAAIYEAVVKLRAEGATKVDASEQVADELGLASTTVTSVFDRQQASRKKQKPK